MCNSGDQMAKVRGTGKMEQPRRGLAWCMVAPVYGGAGVWWNWCMVELVYGGARAYITWEMTVSILRNFEPCFGFFWGKKTGNLKPMTVKVFTVRNWQAHNTRSPPPPLPGKPVLTEHHCL